MNCNKEQNHYHIFALVLEPSPSSSPVLSPVWERFLKACNQSGLFYLRSRCVSTHSRPSSVLSGAVFLGGGLYPRRGTEPDSPKPILTRDYLRSIYPGSPQPLANRKKGISWD